MYLTAPWQAFYVGKFKAKAILRAFLHSSPGFRTRQSSDILLSNESHIFAYFPCSSACLQQGPSTLYGLEGLVNGFLLNKHIFPLNSGIFLYPSFKSRNPEVFKSENVHAHSKRL